MDPGPDAVFRNGFWVWKPKLPPQPQLTLTRSPFTPGDWHLCIKGQCRSEEHTSELQSLMRISYAVFCLKKKQTTNHLQHRIIHDENRAQQHTHAVHHGNLH